MARLRKGDIVAMLSGKDRGKRGKILRMLPGCRAAIVERLNLAKHYERPSQTNQAGGIIERESPITLDKLALVCPRCDRPTRVGWTDAKAETKQRLCRRCKEVLVGS